jgi:hypothetical protein
MRQANRVAHELATRVLANSQVYNFCPPYIESIQKVFLTRFYIGRFRL